VTVNTMIPIARPWMGEEEAGAARRAILSGWVTQGPEVAAFEHEFAAAVGAPFACAVSSCTTALHVALAAIGVSSGDEVVTVSHSIIATSNAIRYCGATPVFVDIAPTTFNIDPALVEAAITPRTKAILAVHQLGMPCDLASLLLIAKRHRVPLIEDAACAVGSEVEWQGTWQRIGRPHGDVACFSFHPRKVLSTGDGGMLTTLREDLDRTRCHERIHRQTLEIEIVKWAILIEGIEIILPMRDDEERAVNRPVFGSAEARIDVAIHTARRGLGHRQQV